MFFKSYYGANRETKGERSEKDVKRIFPLTYHLNFLVLGEEGQEVVADEVGLLVVPVDVESVALFLNLLHGCRVQITVSEFLKSLN